ncbi:uracil-DNA glycosylase family protein [Phaeodactylibacter sp.]|jgi:uracil-DNA glycosylase|uniref:uracil-DNA glycosylase family protein n=1 Tax=Phaeodactylibacter sp. TaxID=1940289 RepID=UPI0025DAE308|nr:uracil-DNA glycosylase family protein [Phaeodactylibacter sp.]MCI4647837.1 uracil-DNA glycosylase family protein [Phaeodactylibacter sp.]MCI5092509.1 uracil-DNA glycosylase family protein [Phaeodactylibacter sp.]
MIEALKASVRHCRICKAALPVPPRPIFAVHPEARIALISQAPGRLAYEKGLPYYDPSGVRLRQWLNVDEATFYDPTCFSILPMGFCYPGKAKTGDLPPRPECAPQWHAALLRMMPKIVLTLYIGQYAQQYYLGNARKRNLTETVRAYREYGHGVLPLPHPSPLNNRWLSRNPWFNTEVVPYLQAKVEAILGGEQ